MTTWRSRSAAGRSSWREAFAVAVALALYAAILGVAFSGGPR